MCPPGTPFVLLAFSVRPFASFVTALKNRNFLAVSLCVFPLFYVWWPILALTHPELLEDVHLFWGAAFYASVLNSILLGKIVSNATDATEVLAGGMMWMLSVMLMFVFGWGLAIIFFPTPKPTVLSALLSVQASLSVASVLVGELTSKGKIIEWMRLFFKWGKSHRERAKE